MSKRSASSTRSGPWIYIALIAVLYVLGSLAYALSTSDTACGAYNAGREWRYIPPGWDCPSPNF